MFFLRVRVDQYVIHVCQCPYVQHVREDMVHHILISGRGIGESEWHNLEFEKPIPGPKRRFPFISFADLDQVESILEVHFCEPLRPLDPVL